MKVTKKSVPASTTDAESKKFDKLINHTNKIKGKFSSMDEEGRKKALLGVAGAFAVLTSIVAMKKVGKRKKRAKEKKQTK